MSYGFSNDKYQSIYLNGLSSNNNSNYKSHKAKINYHYLQKDKDRNEKLNKNLFNSNFKIPISNTFINKLNNKDKENNKIQNYTNEIYKKDDYSNKYDYNKNKIPEIKINSNLIQENSIPKIKNCNIKYYI